MSAAGLEQNRTECRSEAAALRQQGYEAYERGDLVAAFALFSRGAELGDGEAAALVGVCLQTGYGTAPDPSEARRWFDRAARAGFPADTLRTLLKQPE